MEIDIYQTHKDLVFYLKSNHFLSNEQQMVIPRNIDKVVI